MNNMIDIINKIIFLLNKIILGIIHKISWVKIKLLL